MDDTPLDARSASPSRAESPLDAEALQALIIEHGPHCLRLAKALTKDSALAEDIVQQSFLAAFRASGGLRKASSARSWLLTITRHTAYRVLKKEAHHHEPPLLDLGVAAGWGSEDPEATAIAAERKLVLHAALDSLAEADREILVLRDLEQLDGAEAAQILGIGVRAMKSRLHRARLRLAVALRRGGDSDEGA